jgi:predicted Rossmann fold nucleotide-binding protein DprA/Smf involved in DNA uptake
MNMISQLPQPARFESVGERRLPVQVPIVTYTLSERVQNAKIENAMRAQKFAPPPLPPSQPEVEPRHLLERGDANRKAVLAALDTPKRCSEIAEETGIKINTVHTIIDRLKNHGLVVKHVPVRFWRGDQHQWAATWVRA